MESYRRVSACLLALSLVGLSSGYLRELKKFRAEPWNELRRERSPDLPLEEALESLRIHQVSTRATGAPRVIGVHTFDDRYTYARIHYSGENGDVIFVLTYLLRIGVVTRSNLYRSTDSGASFSNINTLLDNDTDLVLSQNIHSSDYNKSMLIFAHATAARIYYTLDNGETFVRRDLSPDSINPRSIVYHPTHDSWMMALDTAQSLYVTVDLAATWRKIDDHVVHYVWADRTWDHNPSTIYYTTEDQTHSGLVNLFTTNHPYDTHSEFDTNLGNHDEFLMLGPFIFVQRTDNGVRNLYVSYHRQPFQRTVIPSPFAHQNYLVARTSNGLQALVIVEHEGGFYNLYFSDLSGVYFSLSLRDIVVEGRNTLHLEQINGVNGTLIASQYVREDPSVTNSPMRTLITLDNGGFWELVLPPDEDLNGNAITCEPPDCSLHFHMDTSEYARLGVYSTDSAPGIIVAHGSIGEQLSDSPDLYISRDGGVTWEETLEGSWGVNVADHGGLMVAARDYHQESSNELMYSCDEGYSWQRFVFSQNSTTIFGVITQPGQHTAVMSLYGLAPSHIEWVVITINFTSVFNRGCVDDDYYDWRPWDVRSDTDCILGSSVAIERRKPQVCCLNGRDYVREINFTICECNSEDFECDYGYVRPGTDLTGPCMRDPAVDLPDPCSGGLTDTYNASTGYRKIAGDMCKGGVETLHDHYEVSCSFFTTIPLNPSTVFFFISTIHTPSVSFSSALLNTLSLPSASAFVQSLSSTFTSSSSSSSSSLPSASVFISLPPSHSSSHPSASVSTSLPPPPPPSPSPNPPSPSLSSAPVSTPISPPPPPSKLTTMTPGPSTYSYFPSQPPTFSPTSSSSSSSSSTSSSSTSDVSKSVLIAVGVVLALVSMAAVIILVLCILLAVKHRSLHHRYLQLATVGEAEMQRYETQSEKDSSLEPLPEEDKDPALDKEASPTAL